MECEDGNDDGKDEMEISSNEHEAETLKEVVSVVSEARVAEAASEHLRKILEKQSPSLPLTGTNNSRDSIENGDQAEAANEKTELDRRVRVGEITPFQAAKAIDDKSNDKASGKWASSQTKGLLGLELYMKRQAELAEQKKKLKNLQPEKLKETSKNSAKPKRKIANDESANISKKRAKDVPSVVGNDENAEMNDETFRRTGTRSKIISATQKDEDSTEILEPKERCSPETGFQDSGSEYVPSDGEIGDSDAEFEKKKGSRGGSKKIRKKGKNLDCDNSFSRKTRVYDDGDESLYKQRIDGKFASGKRKNALFTVDNLFKVPKSIWKRLYEYQKVSVRWLWELHGRDLGGLVGDEMGLGKTVQVIAFLAGLDASDLLSDGQRFRGLGPTLIVCPATLLEQWLKHFQDWCPALRVIILHHSGSYRGEPEYLIESVMKRGGIVLTSYSGVLGHKTLLVESQWHYVILDEGHKIRNPEAKVSKAVKLFSTPHRLLLTGSPMQNSLKELWSLFDFILPGKLGTLPTFLEHCANPITRGGYANASPLQEATALHVATMLKNAIAPYMLRRTKNDVQHHISLPKKNEQVLFCSLTEEQTNLYKEYLRTEHVSSVLHDKSSQTENSYRARLLVALTMLRKICNHPDLYTFGNADADSDEELIPTEEVVEKFGDWKRSGKLAVVRSLLKIWKRQGHRVLLFTQGRQMMGVLEALVQREGYNYLRLDGTTPMTQRQQTIHKFNNDCSYFVFVSTTRVGGLGVNLTGANRVVIYDPDWNPAIDAQARERAWRIGQDKSVTIYRLITAGTVEEKIYHRQIFKVLLSDRILDNPRQRRLFQTSDLAELFNLNEPIDGKTTESDRIFSNCKLEPVASKFSSVKDRNAKKIASSVEKKVAQTSTTTKNDDEDEKNAKNPTTSSSANEMVKSDKKRRKKRSSRSKKNEKDVETECSALFDGEKVPCLIGRRLGNSTDNDEEISSNRDDQYVLNKLFAKSNVSSAYQHDAVLSQAKVGEEQVNPMQRMARDAAEESMEIIRKSRKWCWRPTWDAPKRDDG